MVRAIASSVDASAPGRVDWLHAKRRRCKVRRRKQLAALWAKEPQTAASFFIEYSRAAGITGPFVQQLDKLPSTGFDTPAKKNRALKDLLAKSPQALQAFDFAAVQAARVGTLGFTVGVPSTATLTGAVSVENGKLFLQTEAGKFAVDSPSYEPSLQYRHLEANVLRS